MSTSKSKGSPGKHALNAAVLSAFAIAAGLAFADDHRGISQSGEQRNLRRVGHVDLQGRPSYQPNVIVFPDGRTIAFVGTHGGSKPNTLKPGSPVEPNGTMIVDITDPARPVEKSHIPVPVAGGQAQMARMCLGSDLPGGTRGHVYLTRNVQGSAAQRSGYEIWDVTDVSNPSPVASLLGIRNTHKLWWECKSGLAFMPGSKDVPAPNSLHGPISTFEHPQAAQSLTRGAGPDDVIGNRVYLAWGVGDDGALQIVDRKKLLPPAFGGTWVGDPDRPTKDDLESAQTSLMWTSPDQGGHTSMPIFGLAPPSFQSFTEFQRRDIVILTSEATADRCQEAPHFAFVTDVTVESSRTAPPGTRLEQNAWQGPMILSTMSVDPRRGEAFPRGNYCTRGARFGVHGNEENFRNPFYGKLTVIAFFTGGIRAFDIREPVSPVEVGFYVPEANANTIQPDGYMTNNVEVDNRGFILATDRNGSGLDIVELRGRARAIGLGQPVWGDDDD